MKYFYDFIFLLFSIIYLPYLLFKGKAHKDFVQRFGILPRHLRGDRRDTIWIHAVSVGEVSASRSFMRDLKEAFPDKRIILSTTTKTGYDAAKRIFGDAIPRFYFPIDFHFIIEKTLNFINPFMFILFETEIWPNLIIGLSRRKVPIVLVNGRISDRSFKGYKMIRPIFANTLRRIERFLMQTEEDSRRIKLLGAPPDRVKVVGNVKYDVDQATGNPSTSLGASRQQATGLDKKNLGVSEKEDLIICGSTHKGEEEILLNVYKELLRDFNNLRLLIVPRHIDRVKDIEGLCAKYNFDLIRVSTITLEPRTYNLKPVLILDTIGQLSQLYELATIVFMGGSLVKRGGHNLAEPARFAKAIIFGPYMHNFRDMAGQFLKRNASIMVRDRHQLKDAIRDLLKDRSKIDAMGKKAALLVNDNKGAVGRIVEEIKRIQEF